MKKKLWIVDGTSLNKGPIKVRSAIPIKKKPGYVQNVELIDCLVMKPNPKRAEELRKEFTAGND